MSHKSLEAVEFCRKNGIVMICFPPHSTHRMQPLDVCVFGPLMKHYNEECRKWLHNHPGRVIRLQQVSQLFGAAYRKAATVDNALSGFEKTGLYPVNRDIFPDWMFLPAEVTDLPAEDSPIDHTPTATQESVIPNDAIAGPSGCSIKPFPRINNKRRQKQVETSDSSEDEWNSDSSDKSNEAVRCITPETSELVERCYKPVVSPYDIAPLPKLDISEGRPKRGRKSTALVLTASPNFEELKKKSKLPTKNPVPKKLQASPKESKKTKSAEKEDDVICIFCYESYSGSKRGEMWRQCSTCKLWAHELCAGIDRTCQIYYCDICESKPKA